MSSEPPTTDESESAEAAPPVLDAPTHTAPGPAPEPGPRAFLVAFLTMLAVLVVAELAFRSSIVDAKLHKGSNFILAKRAEYEALGGDIVVTGDSRIYHGINPQVMQDTLQAATGKTYTTFNYGIPSGTTPIFLMAAHDAAIHQPPPRVFILGVTPALFSCCDAVSYPGTQPGVRASAVPLFVRSAWRTDTENAGASVFYGLSDLLALRTELSAAVHDLATPAPIQFQNRGFVSLGARISPATQDVRARGRANGYAELMDKAKGAQLKATPGRYVSAAIEELQRAGVTVVLMGSPQARQLDWYHDDKHTYFEYLAEVKRIAAEHGVRFVDLNAPPGIESADFDGDHLSEPGAAVFTRYVATEIVAPLLQ